MKIGIVGFGNLGKAVLSLAQKNSNMEVIGVFSRRKIEDCNVPCYSIDDAKKFKGKIDVMFMCGGSERDLKTQTPKLASYFNVIDSFDTHALTLEHIDDVSKACSKSSTSAVICCGWDPGLFSVMRTMYSSVFENIECFWGKGISLGHTNAIKKVDGVVDAKQYTVPNKKAVALAKNGNPVTIEKHFRLCYVVANKDKTEIANQIRNIPNYFKGQTTIIKFISQKELDKKHNTSMHQGNIFASTKDSNNTFTSHFEVKMTSNPSFTAKILLAYANAVMKMQEQKIFTALTPVSIPPIWLLNQPEEEVIKHLL